ncbi:MAG: phosphoenolpyruvate synthase [Bacteroidetes bacterium]|nr:phosphoenolpyruvate synthase [Bacteroidota bacterium]
MDAQNYLSEEKPKYNIQYSTERYDFIEVDHEVLMQERIINVLLICSNYDSFMLEEDGRINERIFLEYTSKNLRYPPQFTQASSAEMAFELLEKKKFDLVISMLNIGKIDVFEMAKMVKKRYPKIPIVVLTHFSREVSQKLSKEDLSSIDYVFSWLGNANLLLAIIKLIEDKMNAEYDILEMGVQAILLVEDSIRYYSSYLPTIYQVLFEQTNELMIEGLNEHRKTLRMRARPKILLAKNYEDAIAIYNKYKHNLLGVISDIRYPHNGKKDNKAGIKLAQKVLKETPNMPIILQSSQDPISLGIDKMGVAFIHKYSKTLLLELRNYIKENYGFGDFVFKSPITKNEVDRANNLHSLQVKLASIPADTLEYHVSNNHFSRWLKARALFAIASIFADKSRDDFNNVEEIRNYLIDTIANYRRKKGLGIIASHIDEYAIYTRLGEGQLGGKGRGLAFIDSLIKKHKLMYKWDDIIVTIPRTVVLTTDIFVEFMEENNLYEFAMSDASDNLIMERFASAHTPFRMRKFIDQVLECFVKPLAVRSSSLLEDSHYQPFAGVYSTFMIANNHEDLEVRTTQLEQAIKCVYASVFYKESKAYIGATTNVIDEEKMAVIIQEISGNAYGDKFYPVVSGVARSVNFYPIDPEKYGDGTANIAFGLGKTVVEGGVSLRFCPKYPQKALLLSSVDIALTDSQKEFYALYLDSDKFRPSVDESVNLFKGRIKEAENDKSLRFVASTFDYEDHIIRDGIYDKGKKLITFANILKYNAFPLGEILNTILKLGKQEMNNEVEIEFAVDMDVPDNTPQTFYFLQIRPIVETHEKNLVTITPEDIDKSIISSNHALGNGIISNLFDIVYVKPEAFNPADTNIIADVIDKINSKFTAEKKNYILVGPGRWGSSDPWLGVPVKWSNISSARLIVESSLKNFRIDFSQGTHFFQNLTSFHVGYFSVNPFINDGFYDVEFLNNAKPMFENQYIRHVRFNKQITVKIDGRKKTGVVLKPEK